MRYPEPSNVRLSSESGFIRWILIIIVIVILLSYLGIDLRSTVEDERAQSNFSFVIEFGRDVWSFIVGLWDGFIREPTVYVWHEWIMPIFDSVRGSSTETVVEDATTVE